METKRRIVIRCQSVTAVASTLFALLSIPGIVVAQERAAHHHHYKFIDLGTLGGPHSYASPNGVGSRLLNRAGVVAAYAQTSAPDPLAAIYCYGPPECLVAHAFRWSHGVITDLGAVDDRYSSAAVSINDRGWSTGQSETGAIDPIFNFPLFHTVLWKGTTMVDIGTLPGGTTSIPLSINNAGQVVAFGNNDIPDPFALALFPSLTQMRTFVWQDGHVQDIGTLGGPDAVPGPGCDNQRPGVVVGQSYVSFTPNPDSGIPTLDPFLWDNGTMTDLGNPGGTNNRAQCVNNRGQVIGMSNLPGDLIFHAFLWQTAGCKISGHSAGLFPRRSGSMIPERSPARPTYPHVACMTPSSGSTVGFMISEPFLEIRAAAHTALTHEARLWAAHPRVTPSFTHSCGKRGDR